MKLVFTRDDAITMMVTCFCIGTVFGFALGRLFQMSGLGG